MHVQMCSSVDTIAAASNQKFQPLTLSAMWITAKLYDLVKEQTNGKNFHWYKS